MSKIEKSVQDLAVALDELSARIERQILAGAEDAEAVSSSKNQALAAQKHANKAALDLAAIISDLKALIAKNSAALETTDNKLKE